MPACHDCPIGPGRRCPSESNPRLCALAGGATGRAAHWRAAILRRAGERRPGPDLPAGFPRRLGPGRVRVGLVAPCLNQGGAEAWMLTLARACDPARLAWAGCAVTGGEADVDPGMRAAMARFMPVAAGREAARALARESDVLVLWATEDIPGLVRGLARPPRVVAACHSPVDSPWGVGRNARAEGVDRWVGVSELAVPAIPEAARESVPTSVIWNCVDADRLEVRRTRAEMRARWGVPGDAKVAGYLGRLSEEKDPHAMRRMVDHLPGDWHAALVGAGAEAVDPHPRLHLVGNDPAAGDVLNAFDVLVVPSKYESFGLTIAEGLWAGLPEVTTPVGIARMVPGLTREVPVGADGPTLAAAVLAAHASGPMPGSRDWARGRLAPDRFGREWTDLILDAARPTPRPGPHLADCGDDVWVGSGAGCDEGAGRFDGVIHIWRGDPEGWGVCRHVLGGKPGGLVVRWKEEELTGAMAPTFGDVMAYARRPGTLLVHCAAGVTRSTAVALAAKIARGCPAAKAEADIRAAMTRDRGKPVLWNEGAVAEILAGSPPKSPTPGVARQSRLSVLRNACPHASKPPGSCGCSDERACAKNKGNDGVVTRLQCYACLESQQDDPGAAGPAGEHPGAEPQPQPHPPGPAPLPDPELVGAPRDRPVVVAGAAEPVVAAHPGPQAAADREVDAGLDPVRQPGHRYRAQGHGHHQPPGRDPLPHTHRDPPLSENA